MSSMALTVGMSAISAVGKIKAGSAEQKLYDKKASQALLKGDIEAAQYAQMGADVLTRLNENLAALIANSAVGGGVGSEDKPSNQLNITVKTDKSVTSNANSVQNEQQIQGSAQVKDNSTAVNAGNNATLKIEGSLERWHRGGGRTLDQANAQTKQWLLDQGFQPDQIRGDLQREAFRELRARGPHFTNKDTLRIGKTVLQRKNQPIEQVET